MSLVTHRIAGNQKKRLPLLGGRFFIDHVVLIMPVEYGRAKYDVVSPEELRQVGSVEPNSRS